MKDIIGESSKIRMMSTRDLAFLDSKSLGIIGFKQKQLVDLQMVLKSLINAKKPSDVRIEKIAELVQDAIKVGEDYFRGITH